MRWMFGSHVPRQLPVLCLSLMGKAGRHTLSAGPLTLSVLLNYATVLPNKVTFIRNPRGETGREMNDYFSLPLLCSRCLGAQVQTGGSTEGVLIVPIP